MRVIILICIFWIFPFVSNALVFKTYQNDDTTITSKTPKYGKDSISCVNNLIQYRKLYKVWKSTGYKSDIIYDIYEPWHYTFKLCPASSENIYVDGIRIIKTIIKNEPDIYRKNLLIDTIMLLYDKRIEYFPLRGHHGPQKGRILARKGVDLYKLDSLRYADVYIILRQSINLEKENSKVFTCKYFLKSMEKMYNAHILTKEEALYEFDMIFKYYHINIENNRGNRNNKKVAELSSIKTELDNVYNRVTIKETIK